MTKQKQEFTIGMIIFITFLGIAMIIVAITYIINENENKDLELYWGNETNENETNSTGLMFFSSSKLETYDYSKHGFYVVSLGEGKDSFVIYECENSSLVIRDNKLICERT